MSRIQESGMFGRALGNIILKSLIRRIAHARGFLDPMKVLAQVSRFAQPSEVMAPTELLRSGAVLHARGLINSQAIQHNLDWVWPYWVEKQFDPNDESFVPRAFSLTHINLTHRNWTAVGLPDAPDTPIVDPRGLVTPFWDSWSIDCWIIDEDNDMLLPSKIPAVSQRLECIKNLTVITESRSAGKELVSSVMMSRRNKTPFCEISLEGKSKKSGWLVVSLRPYNPEGISFIHQIERLEDNTGWRVNKKHNVYLSVHPTEYQLSEYRRGDVFHYLFVPSATDRISCHVGMATAAAIYELQPDVVRCVNVTIPMEEKHLFAKPVDRAKAAELSWTQALKGVCAVDISDRRHQNLYDAALRTLILHTGEDVFAGPYTYKRFWFRDAVFIVHALLCAGLKDRARDVIERFPKRQKVSGYFESQEGEWDSNGEVLWILKRYVDMTNRKLDRRWKDVIRKAAGWIMEKRLPQKEGKLESGLMPSGFSAEHLGPSDYYYWDNFWSIAGLQAAAELMMDWQDENSARKFQQEAGSLLGCVERILRITAWDLQLTGMPASPFRRMDSGAIGSLAVGYPLQIWDGNDPRLLQTVNYLIDHCLVNGGFFHDMSHSGINPYLTLHIAQVLLRAGDMRFFNLMNAIADFSSPTGQWPEAIHPKTGGGCMGDGQHVWAAAEWTMMVRNCFLREDKKNRYLILFPGVLPHWYANQQGISFGPAPTSLGDVSLSLTMRDGELIIDGQGQWHGNAPFVEIRLPGWERIMIPYGSPFRTVLQPQGVSR